MALNIEYVVQNLKIYHMHLMTGWVQLKLVEKANEGNMAAYHNSGGGEVNRGVGATIDQLEEKLRK